MPGNLSGEQPYGNAPRALVVGTGLIGSSIGKALRNEGWNVSGMDTDPQQLEVAMQNGAVGSEGWAPGPDLAVVAVPPDAVVETAAFCLGEVNAKLVTDVASVKSRIVASVNDPRFIGGHPMAGSEQLGAGGADGAMFVKRTWVLTPGPHSDPEAYAKLHGILTAIGAHVVGMDALEHDKLVAMVSHVPHLSAAALMNIATNEATDQDLLMKLAAGGFRDMTRIASGSPDIWPQICSANSEAISESLGQLIHALERLQAMVGNRDGEGILRYLENAQSSRRNFPPDLLRPEDLCEVRATIYDRPGEIASVAALAGGLGVNIADIEIAHSIEGEAGIVVMLVDTPSAERFASALRGQGRQATVQTI